MRRGNNREANQQMGGREVKSGLLRYTEVTQCRRPEH